MNKYFVSFSYYQAHGQSFDSNFFELDYKLDSGENLYKLQNWIEEWKCGKTIPCHVTVLFFKEIL